MAAEGEHQENVTKSPAATPAASSAASRDGTFAAMGREALKDILHVYQWVFFDCPPGPSEMGTPLNPLPSEIRGGNRADQPAHGQQQPAPTAGDIAHDRDIQPRGSVYGPETGRSLPSAGDIAHDRDGQMLEQKTFVEKELEREQQRQGSSDGYDRQQERIKPQEERERDREQERGERGR